MRLHDKVALVTGGNRGIGKAAALLFAAEGAKVVIAARAMDKAAGVVSQIRAADGTAEPVTLDVRDSAACAAAVEKTVSLFGRIDILFNNAGIVPLGTALETSDQVWRDVFATNVDGTFFCSRAVLPHMIRQGGGVILNNCSDWGIVGGHQATAYSATKGAVALMTKSMALDYARAGIRVNAVCPGDTVVDRWRERVGGDEEAFQAYLDDLGTGFPIGRVGTVEEIARACLFLVSDESSYMTGHLLVVDGGNTAGGTSTRYDR